MMGHHLSASAFCNVCKPSGVCRSRGGISCPISASRFFIEQVVWERINRAVEDEIAILPDTDRVTVRRRAGDAADRDGAARRPLIFDDDRLAERLPHALREHDRHSWRACCA